jgi:hypothetical protein
VKREFRLYKRRVSLESFGAGDPAVVQAGVRKEKRGKQHGCKVNEPVQASLTLSLSLSHAASSVCPYEFAGQHSKAVFLHITRIHSVRRRRRRRHSACTASNLFSTECIRERHIQRREREREREREKERERERKRERERNREREK